MENRGGSQFLSPWKGRVMKKMTGKEGESQKIKPPRSWKDALIYIMFYKNTNHFRQSWHAIISWHKVQPPLSGHNYLLAIPMTVFFVVTSIKRPCIKTLIHLFWLYFKNTMKENTVGDRSWSVCAWNGSHNYQATVSLHFDLFCFLFACIFVTCPCPDHHFKCSPLKQHSEE